jgi:hypothetical protein
MFLLKKKHKSILWNKRKKRNTDRLRKLDLLFHIYPKDGTTRKDEMELLATLFFLRNYVFKKCRLGYVVR